MKQGKKQKNLGRGTTQVHFLYHQQKLIIRQQELERYPVLLVNLPLTRH